MLVQLNLILLFSMLLDTMDCYEEVLKKKKKKKTTTC